MPARPPCSLPRTGKNGDRSSLLGASQPRRIELLDTTLREGEQTPGVTFQTEEKLEIARQLDAFGIDILEIGHPAVCQTIEQDARALVSEELGCQTLAHARALPADIEAAAATGADWVGIFFSVSDPALEHRFRRDRQQATELITSAIDLARDHGLQVRYTPEDTVRTPLDTVLSVSQAACQAGADRISVADTAGCMTPGAMRDFVARLVDGLSVPIHVHCHDDLGMAVANSLAAVEAGAHTVDVTVGGLGERCGITSLAPLATALTVTGLAEDRWQLDALPALAETVAQATGLPIPPQAPVVGANAFAHNAGLHVAAVLQDPSHYESIPAERVGRHRRIVLDRMSGQAAVAHRLAGAGLEASQPLVDRVLHVLKALGPDDVSDTELRELVATIQLAQEPLPAAPEDGARSDGQPDETAQTAAEVMAR